VKLTIFGATGRTGRPLVAQALAAGHDVTVLVRDPARLSNRHPALTVIAGDVLQADDVERAIVGADAVLSALGQVKGSPKNLLTVATGHIVAAMQNRVGWVGVSTGPRIGRGDVADFMLKQAEGTSYLRQAPMISA
jgi:putative NADH-flavin reductase